MRPHESAPIVFIMTSPSICWSYLIITGLSRDASSRVPDKAKSLTVGMREFRAGVAPWNTEHLIRDCVSNMERENYGEKAKVRIKRAACIKRYVHNNRARGRKDIKERRRQPSQIIDRFTQQNHERSSGECHESTG